MGDRKLGKIYGGQNVEIRLLRMIRESVKKILPTNIRHKPLMGREGFKILGKGLLNNFIAERHPFHINDIFKDEDEKLTQRKITLSSVHSFHLLLLLLHLGLHSSSSLFRCDSISLDLLGSPRILAVTPVSG